MPIENRQFILGKSFPRQQFKIISIVKYVGYDWIGAESDAMFFVTVAQSVEI